MPEASILTSRLILRPLLEDDASRLFEYRSDPSVRRYQSFEPQSVEDARRFIEAGSWEHSDVWHQLGIRVRSSGALVGDLGFRFSGEQPHQAEIGVTVAPEHQGQGIATEALAGLLAHLFGSLGTHRVFASVDPRNGPSMAMLQRVGMRQEGHFRQSLWFKGGWADDVVFAILSSEWEPATA
ncbi:MAG TPA: GNAT family protein [Thermoleophilia bacterium]